MPPVAVVSDSTAYLPPGLAEREGISLVDLYIVFGGDRTVPESEITDYPAFFEELRAAEQLPTTSQPSVGDFVSVYEPLLAQGNDVVSIHISGGPVGDGRVGPAGGRDARARRQGRRARPGDRLDHHRRGPRPGGARGGACRGGDGAAPPRSSSALRTRASS